MDLFISRIAFLIEWLFYPVDNALQFVATPLLIGVGEAMRMRLLLQREKKIALPVELLKSGTRFVSQVSCCWAMIALRLTYVVGHVRLFQMALSLSPTPMGVAIIGGIALEIIVYLTMRLYSTRHELFFSGREVVRLTPGLNCLAAFLLPDIALLEIYWHKVRDKSVVYRMGNPGDNNPIACLNQFADLLSKQVTHFYLEDSSPPPSYFNSRCMRQWVHQLVTELFDSKGSPLSFHEMRGESNLVLGYMAQPPIRSKVDDQHHPFQTLTVEEKQSYENLGKLMAFCYNSCGFEGRHLSATTGRWFPNELFSLFQSLTEEELQQEFRSLPLARQVEMCQMLLTGPSERVSPLKNLLLSLSVMRHGDSASASDKQPGLLESIESLLYPTEGESIGTWPAAAHAMAQGFSKIAKRSYRWRSALELNRAVQGSADPKYIVSLISNRAGRQGDWVMEWILAPTTTERQIAQFLTFVTGGSSLSDSYIRLQEGSRFNHGYFNGLELPTDQNLSKELFLQQMESDCSCQTSPGMLLAGKSREGLVL